MNDLLLQSRVLAFIRAQHHRLFATGRAGITLTITCTGTHYGNV